MSKINKYQAMLRKRPTAAEKRFQKILTPILVVYKSTFTFQEIFHNRMLERTYIVDFYLPKYRVVFEIDGESHQKEASKRDDACRDEWFAKKKILVVRISNQQTKEAGLCQSIIFKSLNKRKTGKANLNDKRPKIIRQATIYEEDGNTITVLPPFTRAMALTQGKGKRKRTGSKKQCRMESPGSLVGSVYWRQ